MRIKFVHTTFLQWNNRRTVDCYHLSGIKFTASGNFVNSLSSQYFYGLFNFISFSSSSSSSYIYIYIYIHINIFGCSLLTEHVLVG